MLWAGRHGLGRLPSIFLAVRRGGSISAMRHGSICPPPRSPASPIRRCSRARTPSPSSPMLGVWEVLQFGSAELMSPGRWRLRRLLRGQLGTQDAIGNPTPAGAQVVMLDAAVADLSIADGSRQSGAGVHTGRARAAALQSGASAGRRSARRRDPAVLDTTDPVGRRRQLGSGRGAAGRGARGVRTRNPRRRPGGAQRGSVVLRELHLHHRG